MVSNVGDHYSYPDPQFSLSDRGMLTDRTQLTDKSPGKATNKCIVKNNIKIHGCKIMYNYITI